MVEDLEAKVVIQVVALVVGQFVVRMLFFVKGAQVTASSILAQEEGAPVHWPSTQQVQLNKQLAHCALETPPSA